MIELARPLVIFDLETTGTDPREDRIVQLAMERLVPCDQDDCGEHPAGFELQERKVYLFNPGIPIPPGATEVHGITDEMVANEPPFAARARAMCSWLEGCDFAGYNIRRFDLPLLYEECKRAGAELPVAGAALVDVATLYFMLNPRSLEDAARRYAEGFEFQAHDAGADVEATRRVLLGILAREDALPRVPAELHAICDEEWGPVALREVDRWFDWDPDGEPIFAIGKHRGSLVRDEPGYVDWMRREIKDEDVLQVLNLAMLSRAAGRPENIRERFLNPPQTDLGL